MDITQKIRHLYFKAILKTTTTATLLNLQLGDYLFVVDHILL